MRYLVVALAGLVFACSAFAADSTAKSRSPFAAAASAAEATASGPEKESLALPPEEYRADLADYASHLRWQRAFARDSWEWHLFSTKLLMAVVLAIVAIGLFLTYLQFTRDTSGRIARAMERRAAKLKEEGKDDADVLRSSIKIGIEGVEITSQVIGLLVLAFSLAFFYLYVKEVYPMQEVELQRQAKAAAEKATSEPDNAKR